MGRIDRIEFVQHRPWGKRRHYVSPEDVRVVLSRLPEELWSRLRRVVFNDRADGNRTYGYTTRERREISICALPVRVSLNTVCMQEGQKPESFGAMRNSQWPGRAVRRWLLYNTLLHEIGHLQLVLPQSKRPSRQFAGETKAQEFADHWRRSLWAEPFDHEDPVHNAPSQVELGALRASWREAHLSYKKGLELDEAGQLEEARAAYQKAVELYPDHALALEHLGMLAYRLSGCRGRRDELASAANSLRWAIALDPASGNAYVYLADTLVRLGQRGEAHRAFERALQLEPYATWTMTAFAMALSRWGDHRETDRLFAKVLRKDPNCAWTLREYARHVLYRAEGSTERNTAKGMDLLERAVAAEPKDSQNHYALALAHYRRTGDYDRALDCAMTAMTLNTDADAGRYARLALRLVTLGV